MGDASITSNEAGGGRMSKTRAFPGRIIFDHIPKTAGESIRHWLTDVLGNGVVSEHVNGTYAHLIKTYGGLYSIIPAHLHFTDTDGSGLDPRYQHITLLRNPVDRVVSWLYFVTVNPHDINDKRVFLEKKCAQRMLDTDGLDVDPEISGDVSNPYVNHFSQIKDVECTSDEGKLLSAISAIKEYDVVGFLEDMPRFSAEVADLIGVSRPDSILRVNETIRRPSIGAISDLLRTRIIELNKLDIRFYDAVRAWKDERWLECHNGDASTHVPMWDKYERLNTVGNIVTSVAGWLAITGAMHSSLIVGQKVTINVEIHNGSEQGWIGDLSRPIKLSYHWIDQTGAAVVFDGLRTPVPKGGIPQGQTVCAEMTVLAPEVPGRYVLVLTVLQERVVWFEKRGFAPARFEVEII